MNRVVLDDLVGPFAELHRALVFNFEAHGNDGLQTVVVDLALNLAVALGLNR